MKLLDPLIGVKESATMKCSNCQHENLETANFCNKCGTKLTLAVPDLSALEEKINKIQRYLPQGLTERILSQKSKIEGERKQITVLFCDLVGFTSMSEKLGPEDTYSFVDRLLEILVHKVHDYGGTVNQLLGDGLYALFGVPIAIEDASSRAIRSAIDMHNGIREFSDKITQEKNIPALRMRIGINSGPVVVGTVGNSLRVDFSAVGDTVNLASRMEGLAEPGTITVTEETYKRAQLYFNFEALGEKIIKGKEKPVSVYKVVSEKEKVHRRLTSERTIHSEMVGRETEMDKLELAVSKVKNGEGSIVNIIGEAGIGKSRLIAELKSNDAVKRTVIGEGRALSMGRNLSFYPIIEILKGFTGIGDDDAATEQLFKLETAVKDIHAENADEIIPFIGSLMGLQLSEKYAERVKGIEGEALERLIYKNLRDLILKSAEQTPLIFILEDLHWADTSSIDLIISLFRLVENSRILIINIFRPHYEETGGKLMKIVEEQYLRISTEINLHRLSPDQSDLLINNLLKIKGLPTEMREQIKKRSEGNPFFIEEMARSMIDEGAIELKNGKFKITRKIETVIVPNTIQELLMSRIDRLDEKTKSLLRTASVIGRHFFHKVLTEVMETVEDIDDKLGYLQDIQLIKERKRMNEVEYLFKHALAQETTYESILIQNRKKLHLKVAESFERVFTERLNEFYGMLAYHFVEAENMDKAEEYMIKAGEEAMKSSASNEAFLYYKKAQNLYNRKYGKKAAPQKTAMFDKNIALALYSRGQYVDAIAYYDRTLRYYWGELPANPVSAGLRFTWAALYLLTALFFPFLMFNKSPGTKDIDGTELFYKKSKALAITDPKRFVFEFMYLCREVTKFDLAKINSGLEIFLGSSALFSFSGISFYLSKKILEFTRIRLNQNNDRLYINYLFLETIHNFLKGEWDALKEYDDDLVERVLNRGEIYDASQYTYWHGVSNIFRGQMDVALLLMNRLSQIVDLFQNDFSLLLKFDFRINLLIERRELDEALKEVKEALRFVKKLDNDVFLFEMHVNEAWIQLLLGEVEKAAEALQGADGMRKVVNAVPVELSAFYRSQMEYYLFQLKASQEKGHPSDIIKVQNS